jgi:hypothetical protein
MTGLHGKMQGSETLYIVYWKRADSDSVCYGPWLSRMFNDGDSDDDDDDDDDRPHSDNNQLHAA